NKTTKATTTATNKLKETYQDTQPERDINDIFDDIILTEERLVEKSYKEGFTEGCQQGNADGYRLGFAQGLQLGEELAEIFGLITALQQQNKHTDKVKRCMEQLRSLIEEFPRENDPEADIIGALEQIRNLNKRLRISLGLKAQKKQIVIMSCQILQKRVDSILQFMSPHWSWVNCHMVNYLTDNHWHNFVPSELHNELSNFSTLDECIEEVFWNIPTYMEESSCMQKFPQFKKFRLLAQQHSLHSFKDVIITATEFEEKVLGVSKETKQQIKIKEFLTEKKQHEVEITAALVNNLISNSSWREQTIIVDAGDGKGYLSSRLALEYGHKVLGIDSNTANTQNAIERSKKLKKAWNGLKERAELESKGLTPARRGNLKQKLQQKSLVEEKLPLSHENDNYKTIDKFITSDMDLVGIIQQQFAINCNQTKSSICLTGLHTCGNLAATCLKLFHTQASCKLMCNIGCCYHLLKEQFSTDEFLGNKEISNLNQEIGFPLSSYLKGKEIKLGRNARMLAAQSIERVMAAKELPNISLYYRALLELLICEEHKDLENTVQVGKIRKFSNFKEYVDLCRKKYPHLNLKAERIDEIFTAQELSRNKKYLDLFYLLRMTFAPVLESLILLDRLLFLREKGYEQSYLIPVFDPVVSPRHFAIVAIKNQ
ncbi:Methyltransferase-like protein 25, partial [Lucilia cuprina]